MSDPIEAGFQSFIAALPPLSDNAAEALRLAFFAGATHYRSVVQHTFALENGEELVRTLVALAVEMDRIRAKR